MKKQHLLCGLVLTLALLVLCACALAETVEFIADGSVTVQPADGLAYTADYDKETHTWNIVIDTKATKWADVIASGMSGRNMRLFHFVYNPASVPADAVNVSADNWKISVEDGAYGYYLENLEFMPTRVPSMNPQRASVAVVLGTYDADSGLYFPQNITQKMYSSFSFRWRMKDGMYKTEHALYTIAFSPDANPVSMPIERMPASYITPDTAMSSEKSDGSIAYKQAADLASPLVLITRLMAPAGATKAFDGVDPLNMQGSDALLELGLSAGDSAEEKSHFIVWKDDAGSVVKRWSLSEKATVGQPKPWPLYVNGLEPHGSSLKVKKWGQPKGVELDMSRYDAYGEVRLTADAEVLLADAAKGIDLTRAGVDFTITPPKQARYYRQFPNGSWNIYDRELQWSVYPLYSDTEKTVPLWEIEDGKIRERHGYLAKKEVPLANGGSMTYYYCDELAGSFAGLVDMIFWYNENQELIGQNYMIHTFDDVPLITTAPVVSKESDVANHKGKPVAVFKGAPGTFENISLLASRYPSSGNTHYYDLKLVGPDGAEVSLSGEEVELYLPFPEGHSENSVRKLNITVGHYDDTHSLIASDVCTLENGKLEITPCGLKLRVKSFSPYVVSWEEPAVPRTGDDFPMALLLGALCLSLLLGAKLRRRAKA